MGNSEMIDSSNRLAPFSASRSFPRRGRFSICGLRPLYRQPSLDREGVDEVDGWDDGWVICICDSAVSAGLHQSSPHRCAEPPFQGWLFWRLCRREDLGTRNFYGSPYESHLKRCGYMNCAAPPPRQSRFLRNSRDPRFKSFIVLQFLMSMQCRIYFFYVFTIKFL